MLDVELILSVQDLAFGFHKDAALFSGVSFALKKGESIAVTGRSGIGKSTLLKLLVGSLQPDTGRIQLFGKDLSITNPREVNRLVLNKVGEIKQHPYFLPELTAVENIAVHLSVVTGLKLEHCFPEAHSVLESFSIHPQAQIAHLSGGELSRLQICRALVIEPELVIADEPTAALDEKTKHDVVQRLIRHDGSLATVIVTHDIKIVEQCDYRIELGVPNAKA